ncbi:FAD/NAD(P)-binding protein [Apilactobacillus sp. M161]|uniref:FAD/NAD(P)-binding protein n=1 Tax=Apilactobacillus xinyiensis TaxID=2841032 RepID=A0ABT0I0P9_9LACO|nr:FAD/NAD(P)-binding protein [Apilactobacillus xinyiensis]MCK8624410.1 FAD/NAD(P)-binding protein [Apilactobacillus xinyiensis]
MKVAIIGAGPRGLIASYNLLKDFQKTGENLEINLFDKKDIGGRVWNANQSPYLIMNTPATEITLFNYDDPYKKSLYEWCKSDDSQKFMETASIEHKQQLIDAAKNLSSNGYADRALLGVYCKWFFQNYILTQQNEHLSIKFMKNSLVDNISVSTNQKYTIILGNQDKITNFNKIIISLGQQENHLTENETSLYKYAKDHNLNYFLPGYPSEQPVEKIPANENVIIRGLGLSFNDYVSLLTIGRGGKFIQNGDSLKYIPSGKEPKIIAGSRRGVPYFPKALSQKTYDEKFEGHFLIPSVIKKNLTDGKLKYEDLVRLLKLDIEYRYYTLLINRKYSKIELKAFQNDFIQNNGTINFEQKYNIDKSDIFNWEKMLNPVAGVKITTTDDYQKDLLEWLDFIIKDAKLGSKTGPITASIEMLRDLRSNIRWIVANQLLSSEDYVNKFQKQFMSTISFLSMGAPVIRSEQLAALIRADIVKILGPQMMLIGADKTYKTCSMFYKKEIFSANNLIEARIPKASTKYSKNILVENLIESKLIHLDTLQTDDGKNLTTDSIDIDLKTNNIKDSSGKLNHNIYVWGLSTAGKYFIPSAFPTPSKNDENILMAQKISHQIVNEL